MILLHLIHLKAGTDVILPRGRLFLFSLILLSPLSICLSYSRVILTRVSPLGARSPGSYEGCPQRGTSELAASRVSIVPTWYCTTYSITTLIGTSSELLAPTIIRVALLVLLSTLLATWSYRSHPQHHPPQSSGGLRRLACEHAGAWWGSRRNHK